MATGNQENRHKVPKKQWTKWADVEQRMFNYLMDTMTSNPRLFQHPNTSLLQKEWDAIKWNTSWLVADGLKDIRKNG